jgi:alcohol dehydrogenase class IV
MDKALHMLNLLPTIIELNEISFQEVYKSVSDNISLSNSKTRETIDNIISMIEESKIEDKNKQLAIEQIKKIEEMYLSFLKI